MTFETNSSSYVETINLASKIGRNLKGGEVIELVSDLGGGKTAFVTGLAKGAGISDQVSSPSFTINQIYQSNEITINHYDLYRLSDPGIMKNEIIESMEDRTSILILEWGGSVSDILPKERLTIEIRPTGENTRNFSLSVPESMRYLLKGVK